MRVFSELSPRRGSSLELLFLRTEYGRLNSNLQRFSLAGKNNSFEPEAKKKE